MPDSSWLAARHEWLMGDGPPSFVSRQPAAVGQASARGRHPFAIDYPSAHSGRFAIIDRLRAIRQKPAVSHQPSVIGLPSEDYRQPSAMIRQPSGDRGRLAQGYTFIELLVVSTIVLILASAVMPLANVTATRHREAELRHALREMRTAIDKYKDAADTMQIGPLEIKVGSEGYPPDLETLVEGVPANNDATGRKLKFLRKVPVDPMTHGMDWGLRSYQDKPDSTRWGGQNVFDVYTTFDAKALDGTKYRDW
jgi:general secretion pathway protein G